VTNKSYWVREIKLDQFYELIWWYFVR